MKHTPGPWEPDEMACFVSAENGRMNVCQIRGWGRLTGKGGLGLDDDTALEIQKANAYLIAAAPDMYEALKQAPCMCRCTCGCGDTHSHQFREPHKCMIWRCECMAFTPRHPLCARCAAIAKAEGVHNEEA